MPRDDSFNLFKEKSKNREKFLPGKFQPLQNKTIKFYFIICEREENFFISILYDKRGA